MVCEVAAAMCMYVRIVVGGVRLAGWKALRHAKRYGLITMQDYTETSI